ncbi:MAG: hypothetical protein F4X67_07745 [Gemmatimonadales bacterium]|nr:hypothetical protein [Gemmatimonadales bacterium]
MAAQTQRVIAGLPILQVDVLSMVARLQIEMLTKAKASAEGSGYPKSTLELLEVARRMALFSEEIADEVLDDVSGRDGVEEVEYQFETEGTKQAVRAAVVPGFFGVILLNVVELLEHMISTAEAAVNACGYPTSTVAVLERVRDGCFDLEERLRELAMEIATASGVDWRYVHDPMGQWPDED